MSPYCILLKELLVSRNRKLKVVCIKLKVVCIYSCRFQSFKNLSLQKQNKIKKIKLKLAFLPFFMTSFLLYTHTHLQGHRLGQAIPMSHLHSCDNAFRNIGAINREACKISAPKYNWHEVQPYES